MHNGFQGILASEMRAFRRIWSMTDQGRGIRLIGGYPAGGEPAIIIRPWSGRAFCVLA